MRRLKLTALIFGALALGHAPRSLAQDGGARQSAAEPAAEARWTRYTYPGEEFSAELPAPPAVSHTSRLIPNTRYEMGEGRVFGLYSGGVVFLISSYDDPRQAETLDHFDENVWGGHGLNAVGETMLGGFAGRTYGLRPPLKGAARSFRTKKHAYLLVAMANEEGHEQTFARFLDSLALGPKPSGERIVDTTSTKPDAPPPGAPGPGRADDAGGAAGEGPLRQGDVTRKALVVFKPEPGFTEKARRNNTVGTVRLRCVLSSSGRVTNVSVVKGLPDGLTDMAVFAARHILFFPAVKDGRRVSQYVVLEYNFNIY